MHTTQLNDSNIQIQISNMTNSEYVSKQKLLLAISMAIIAADNYAKRADPGPKIMSKAKETCPFNISKYYTSRSNTLIIDRGIVTC
jgi:hypothetical protein